MLYAIAHAVHQVSPRLVVVYVKGETFTNELIQAIREGSNQEFRQKYRGNPCACPGGSRRICAPPR